MSRKNKGQSAPKADNTASDQVTDQTNESTTTEAAAPADPFADVPVTRIGDDVEFRDFSDVGTSDPRKYAAVNAAARAERLPTAPGWKHERAMLVMGTNRKELKPSSVYGTIQAIVQAAGRPGIPAYVVASMLRQQQVGNKRSHYCEGLPPVGWAEGWINTAITKNIAGVHPTKEAPALRETVTEGEANADAEQKKLAANG